MELLCIIFLDNTCICSPHTQILQTVFMSTWSSASKKLGQMIIPHGRMRLKNKGDLNYSHNKFITDCFVFPQCEGIKNNDNIIQIFRAAMCMSQWQEASTTVTSHLMYNTFTDTTCIPPYIYQPLSLLKEDRLVAESTNHISDESSQHFQEQIGNTFKLLGFKVPKYVSLLFTTG